MNKYYQIIGLNKNIGQLSVKYWTDEYLDGLVYSVDLPVSETNTVPLGEELNTLILSMFPEGQLLALIARLNIVAPVDFTEVEALVVPLVSTMPNTTIPTASV